MKPRWTLVIELDAEPPGLPMFVVTSPDIPGLATEGTDFPEALEMAADAVRCLYRANREPAAEGGAE